MRYLSIKNFDKHQHYKDRRPPWIKLHVALLDDYDFIVLPDVMKGHLMLLWALASQMDNKIPHDVKWITQRIGARSDVDVDTLLERGFLEPWQEDATFGRVEPWASRYISAQTRTDLLSAAQHRCAVCSASEHLEIDHIIPISQGGTGDLLNLQVLCRQCNRRKRARLTEQVATQTNGHLLRRQKVSALPETETYKEETETQKGTHSGEFLETRKLYPKRAGGDNTSDAWKQYQARLKTGETAEVIRAGTVRYAAFIRATGKEGTEYVKQMCTFLGKSRHYLEPWDIPAKSNGNGHLSQEEESKRRGYMRLGDL